MAIVKIGLSWTKSMAFLFSPKWKQSFSCHPSLPPFLPPTNSSPRFYRFLLAASSSTTTFILLLFLLPLLPSPLLLLPITGPIKAGHRQVPQFQSASASIIPRGNRCRRRCSSSTSTPTHRHFLPSRLFREQHQCWRSVYENTNINNIQIIIYY